MGLVGKALLCGLLGWSAAATAQVQAPIEGVVGRWQLPASVRALDNETSKPRLGGQSSLHRLVWAQAPTQAAATVAEICVPGDGAALAEAGLIAAAAGSVRNPLDSQVRLGRYPARKRSGDSGDRPGLVYVAWVPATDRGLASVKLTYAKGAPFADELIAAIEAMDVHCGEPSTQP